MTAIGLPVLVLLCQWICALLLPRIANGEVFTSMADMEALLYAERHIVTIVDQYIEAENHRLNKLKHFAKEYQQRNQEAIRDGSKYLANPINAYLAIKRLTSDWNYVESMMKHNSADTFLQNITMQRDTSHVKFPDNEDLKGAAQALLRLQDTYKLDSSDMARGEIQGVKRARELNAHDCFELGRVAYNEGDHYHVILWMQQAIDLLRHESPETANEEDILEYLAFSMYQQGNVKRAIKLTKRLFALNPKHPRAAGNIKYYQDLLVEEGYKKGDDGDLPPIVNDRHEDASLPERVTYEALCRNELPFSPKVVAKLKCYYKNDRPFLRLAPLKYEVIHYKPKIVIYRGVLSDYEIDVIKQLAQPRLRRATVTNAATGMLETATYRISKSEFWSEHENTPMYSLRRTYPLLFQHRYRLGSRHPTQSDWFTNFRKFLNRIEIDSLRRATVHNKATGRLEYASYRISKSSWLKNEDHPVVARVNRRIEDMTNLDMETAEDLQIANYGIGGHYDPHHDFAKIANYGIGGHYDPHFDMSTRGEVDPYEEGTGNRIATVLFYKEEKDAFKSLGTGNRIATVLFYLSQPQAGGATVFPELKLALFPSQYDAAFWHNLYKSGEGDLSTRHAACPVLAGNKWVSNKWIHERGQEFRRQCALKEFEYE